MHRSNPLRWRWTNPNSSRGSSRGLAAFTVASFVLLTACTNDSPTKAFVPEASIDAAVSGLAAAAVGPDGRIQIVRPRSVQGELTEAAAVTIASTHY